MKSSHVKSLSKVDVQEDSKTCLKGKMLGRNGILFAHRTGENWPENKIPDFHKIKVLRFFLVEPRTTGNITI